MRIQEKALYQRSQLTDLSTIFDLGKLAFDNKEYEAANIAIIRSPHESDWMISVMKYLNECDQNFPDPVQQIFLGRTGSSPYRLN